MKDTQYEFLFNIDIVGSCNLRCPSCPAGNCKEIKNPRGTMEPSLLNQIMDKATSTCHVIMVGLFNWAEPMLHPKLPELIKIVESYNVPCSVSSNLNILKNTDDIMTANPSMFRISTSGFTQANYGITHRGGDIERVKQNMIALSESKRRIGNTTQIHVLYHRYLGNLDDEVLMKRFAESLGFEFRPVWAFMMPLEKTFAYIDHDSSDVQLTSEDLQLIQRLAMPLDQMLSFVAHQRTNSCSLRDKQMTLDFQGNALLCCAVYNAERYTLAPYLSMSLEELQALKYANLTCKKCMALGLPKCVDGGYEFDRIAYQNIYNHYRNAGFDFSSKFDSHAIYLMKKYISETKKKTTVLTEKIIKKISRIR